MGCYSGGATDRLLQMLYSGLKVPLLLTVAFGLSLPSFFVLNTLAGLRDDFRHCLRALVATQAGLTIILAALAPLTVLWYVSFDNYLMAIVFNMVVFGTASVLAQGILRRYYGPLIERRPRHRVMLKVWLLTYAFVGIQMGWVLRPFVGAPGSATSFFREQAWSNAYVKVFQIVLGALN